MSKHWRVTYELTPHVKVGIPVREISDLALTLEYDENSELAAMHHLIEVADQLGVGQVMTQSRKAISTLFEAVSFLYGPQVDFRTRGATNLSGSVGTSVMTLTHILPVSTDAVLVRPVTLPTGASLEAATKRFPVWLHLANEARNTSNDADAIRTYYLVLEDIKGGIDENSSVEEQHIMYVRHFVSHGIRLDDERAAAFIQGMLGSPTPRFNPINKRQRAFLAEWRARARAVVDGELERRF